MLKCELPFGTALRNSAAATGRAPSGDLAVGQSEAELFVRRGDVVPVVTGDLALQCVTTAVRPVRIGFDVLEQPGELRRCPPVLALVADHLVIERDVEGQRVSACA